MHNNHAQKLNLASYELLFLSRHPPRRSAQSPRPPQLPSSTAATPSS